MSLEKTANPLEEMDKLPVGTAVLKNVLPAIASMLMALIYNMADKVFIGMTGNDLMVSAITMATPVFVLFISFGNIFGTGGVALISRLTGEGNLKKVDKVSSFCFWGSIGVGIIVMLVLLLGMNPIVNALGAKEVETIQYTKEYLSIVAIGCPFAILSTTLSSLVRAEGKPTLSMVGMILGNVVNIVLDPIFILGFGMGPKGAGLATLIGQASGVLFYMVCIFMGKSNLGIRIRDFTLEKTISVKVFAIGTPAALYLMFQSVCNILINNQMSHYGDIAVAGIGAAQNIITLVGIFASGIGTGIQPILGYQIGNRNKKRFIGILRYSLILTAGISLAMTALCYLFTTPIIRAFVTGTEAISYGVEFGRIILLTCWIYCLISVCGMVLQAMGSVKASLIVNMSRNGYIFIPLLFIMSSLLGMKGIVWSYPVSDIICMIISILVLIPEIKKAFAEVEPEQANNICESKKVAKNHTYEKSKTSYVIAIGRMYGAGGRTVGKRVADNLGIPFYDKEIIEVAARQSGLSEHYLNKIDERSAITSQTSASGNIFTTDKPLPSVEKIAYQAQNDAVMQIAERGSCVIVGRRADEILDSTYNVFSVFVNADIHACIKRVCLRDGISEAEAEKRIQRVNRERANYYNTVSEKKWGVASTYDLCVDTATLGIDGAADTIIDALEKAKFHC